MTESESPEWQEFKQAFQELLARTPVNPQPLKYAESVRRVIAAAKRLQPR
jgi:hypothetical protein